MTDKSPTAFQSPSMNPEKKVQKNSSSFLPLDQSKKGNDFLSPVVHIDEKIQLLKKKKEKIQTQQAFLFMKETQKIFKEKFSPELALTILSETWEGFSNSQKDAWLKKAHSFRSSSFQQNRQKAQAPHPTSHEN